MKLAGIAGTGSGKLGSMVYATIAGEQVVRQYQPNVANPSTMSQVNSRAKLKLASQLASALAPVIAIPKEGLKSKRNLFIKRNYGLLLATGGQAQVSYENLQLTNGNGGLAAITASRNGSNVVTIALQDAAAPQITRVVYIIYKKTDDNQLQLVASDICETAGQERTFEDQIPATSGELVLYAYGMCDADAKATAKFGNMIVANASDLATLVANRAINSSEYSFTGTRGATMSQQGDIVEPTDPTKARVYVTALGGGSVSGAGQYTIGEQCTVVATPNTGYIFKLWAKQEGNANTTVSTSATYTFVVEGTTDLVAEFEYQDNGFDPGS